MKKVFLPVAAACLFFAGPATAERKPHDWDHHLVSHGERGPRFGERRHADGRAEAVGFIGVLVIGAVLGALIEAGSAEAPVIPVVDDYDPRSPTGLASDASLLNAGWPRSVSVDP